MAAFTSAVLQRDDSDGLFRFDLNRPDLFGKDAALKGGS
jgi:hypothetical protein